MSVTKCVPRKKNASAFLKFQVVLIQTAYYWVNASISNTQQQLPGRDGRREGGRGSEGGMEGGREGEGREGGREGGEGGEGRREGGRE